MFTLATRVAYICRRCRCCCCCCRRRHQTRGAQWEKAVEIMRDVSATSEKDGGDGIWYHLGSASSLAFNAALVACAKVSHTLDVVFVCAGARNVQGSGKKRAAGVRIGRPGLFRLGPMLSDKRSKRQFSTAYRVSRKGRTDNFPPLSECLLTGKGRTEARASPSCVRRAARLLACYRAVRTSPYPHRPGLVCGGSDAVAVLCFRNVSPPKFPACDPPASGSLVG